MKWEDLSAIDKIGEVLAGLSVFALPYLLLIFLDAIYGL